MGKARAVTRRADAAAWQPIPGLPALSEAVLAEILDGGQSFRWYRSATHWTGSWGAHVVQLRRGENGVVEWTATKTGKNDTAEAVSLYLRAAAPVDSGPSADAIADTLPWRSDPHLATCMAAFPGLRILRQPFGETLLCFLCSATKQIVQIKQMVALLAERYGDRIAPAPADETAPAHLFHRLPTWDRLATIPEAELRKCLLGFRARFIAETARFLAAHPGWLAETESLPYAIAKERLCTLPGVGEKVADCVLLFGASRLEAFPVDVWILKTMARRYALERWKPAQLAQFGRTHFGQYAGLAQQFLFAWERREKRNSTAAASPTA